MAARKAIKRSDALTILARQIRHFVKRQKYARKWNDATKAYLATHQVRKLEIGARVASLDGWLSTDVDPVSEGTAFLDATKPFPFDCGTFDYIYCEHMIEHLSYHQAAVMVSECFRVLKPRGKIRISTPDLDKILALKRPGNDLEQAYLQYATAQLPYARSGSACFAINAFVRNWGHLFIFDKETLTDLLGECGFVDFIECSPGESDISHLRDLEHHGDTFPVREFNLVESMVLEATKPDRC